MSLGMDPLSASLLFSSLANVGGGLLAPGGENVEGFEDIPIDGRGSATIRQLLGQGLSQTGRLADVTEQRLARPIDLSGAVVQTPPSFSGGGLPMDIGLTGRDPALSDPSLLSLPGFKLPSSGDFVADKISNPKFPGSKTDNPKFPGSTSSPPGAPKADNPKFPGPTTGEKVNPKLSNPKFPGIQRRRLDAGFPGAPTTTPGTSSEDLISGEADRALAALFMLQNARSPTQGGGMM